MPLTKRNDNNKWFLKEIIFMKANKEKHPFLSVDSLYLEPNILFELSMISGLSVQRWQVVKLS